MVGQSSRSWVAPVLADAGVPSLAQRGLVRAVSGDRRTMVPIVVARAISLRCRRGNRVLTGAPRRPAGRS
jgi:hypothetical protein